MPRNSTQQVCLNGLVAVLLCASAVPSAAVEMQPVLVINQAQVQTSLLAGAERELARIFGKAGIRLGILNCASVPETAACERYTEEGTLFIHLLAKRPDHRVAKGSLGYAVTSSQGGNNAWVFLPQIDDVITNAKPRASRAQLLGHAMAHEIGHLLAGPEHGRTGLMRMEWNSRDYLQMAKGEMFISAPEAERMRQTVKRQAEAALHVTQ